MKVSPIYTNKILKKGLEFASDNSALFVATTSFVLSNVAKPISIALTPKAKKEDKKNAIIKSISSNIVGYALMFLCSTPVAKATNNIINNPKDFLKNTTIENLKRQEKNLSSSKEFQAMTQLFKLGLGIFLVLPKQYLTTKLIPLVTNNFFNKKNENSNKKSFNFKGNPINFLSKGIAKAMDLNFIQKISKKLANTDFEKNIIYSTDILSTLGFIGLTHKNKNINKEQKKSLILNSSISTALCLTFGNIVDKLLDKPTQKFIQNMINANKNSPNLNKYINGIKIAKPALILGILYYTIIPMLSTYLTSKIQDKMNDKK